MKKLKLYPHNQKALEQIIERINNGEDVTGILHATGTGKTNIAIGLAYNYPKKKILFITRYNSIIDHVKEVIKKTELNIDNISFMTYSKLVNLTREELEKLDVDILITDEFHHVGAPVWESRIEAIRDIKPKIQIVGMSAYSVRDRGTSYERDMAEEDGNELFSNKICSTYTLAQAILDGILPFPRYKTALLMLEEFIGTIENKVKNKYHENHPLYKEFISKLNYYREKLNLQLGMDELIKRNIKMGDKLIYFCPLGKDNEEANIDNIMKEMMDKLIELGYKEEDIVFYKTTSKDNKEGKINREAFYNDTDLNGRRVKRKLRIMFAINQYNEGVHVPNITGVILGRGTRSDIVFYEQIGRALAIKGETREAVLEYKKLNRKQLGEVCEQRNIKIRETMTNDDIIELLVAPTIIDLAGNFVYIRDLVTDVKKEMNRRIKNNKSVNSSLDLTDWTFNTEVIGEDLFNILDKINIELLPKSFDEVFRLASNFYNNYGHLNVPRLFRTDDGINYSQFGYSLGEWVVHMRSLKKKNELSLEQIEKLENIGMEWYLVKTWEESFGYAKEYYEKYGKLNISYSYKTEDGYNLGSWIVNMRVKKRKGLLSEEQIKKLESIGMEWKVIQTFKESYELLKKYYEYYGNIDIQEDFKTLDGINYNSNGFDLREWLNDKKTKYHKGELSLEITILLEKLHINWGEKKKNNISWDEWYKLAKNYYDYYHNLKIKRSFTTNDGINYDEKGFNLGGWIARQQINCKNNKLSEEQISLLNDIGMIWVVHETYKTWEESYLKAVEYYQEFGNLVVPVDYRCSDGYNLSSFVYLQRKKRWRGELSEEQINKLDLIGMVWDRENNVLIIKDILQREGISSSYAMQISNLSVLEISAKIKFIKDNGLSFIEDGKLNQIFNMSSKEFYRIYRVSLNDLITSEISKRKSE